MWYGLLIRLETTYHRIHMWYGCRTSLQMYLHSGDKNFLFTLLQRFFWIFSFEVLKKVDASVKRLPSGCRNVNYSLRSFLLGLVDSIQHRWKYWIWCVWVVRSRTSFCEKQNFLISGMCCTSKSKNLLVYYISYIYVKPTTNTKTIHKYLRIIRPLLHSLLLW